ncbi:MAG: MGMT family protein [Parcubacteria group bacterium]|jgi:O-6-methylguanine DNA methyltransferase
MTSKNTFRSKVIQAVRRIPKGKTLTYKQVAKLSGNEKAARAVGIILGRYYRDCETDNKPFIPCHRVIRSDGRIGGYAKGEKEKRRILKKEKAI